MLKFSRSLLVVVIVCSIINAELLVDDECSSDVTSLSCPENSDCRPLSCRGYRCACNEGFMPDDNSTACIKGAALGEECGSTTKLPCLNVNAVCQKGLISLSPPNCQCEKGFIKAANDLQCLELTDYKRFGEWCEDKCGPTLSCKLGFCTCQPGYRERTALEIQADPEYKYDCVENEFSLSKCKGVDVSLLSDIDANALPVGNQMVLNSTYPTPATNQTTEMGNMTTPDYNLTSPNADNSLSPDMTRSTPVTLPTSTNISLSVSPKLLANSNSSSAQITENMTGTTPALTTSASPTLQNPQSTLSESITTTTHSVQSTLTSQSKTTATVQPIIPANQNLSTHGIPVTPYVTTDQQSNDASTLAVQPKTSTNLTTTTNSIISSSELTTNKTIHTQYTDLVTSSVNASSSAPVATRSQTTGSHTTGTATTNAAKQPTKKILTGSSITLSSVTEKPTPNPTIPSQPAVSTNKILTTIITRTTSKMHTPPKATTVGTVATNVTTKTTATGNPIKPTPATQTRAPANSENRVSTEAIIIPSVLVIVLAIIMVSVIAIIVCRKRRSHISLTTDIDSCSPYKVPRPSMMSTALTSAPSPPSPYNNGDHPSYHYVNDAFENDRL